MSSCFEPSKPSILGDWDGPQKQSGEGEVQWETQHSWNLEAVYKCVNVKGGRRRQGTLLGKHGWNMLWWAWMCFYVNWQQRTLSAFFSYPHLLVCMNVKGQLWQSVLPPCGLQRGCQACWAMCQLRHWPLKEYFRHIFLQNFSFPVSNIEVNLS